MKLIDKDALVAEIERLIKKNELYLDDNVSVEVRYQKTGAYSVLCDIRHFIDTLEVKEIGVDLGDPKGDKSEKHIIDTKTLEVKEVDLTEEIEKYLKQYSMLAVGRKDFTDIAKHFFELGLKAQKGE